MRPTGGCEPGEPARSDGVGAWHAVRGVRGFRSAGVRSPLFLGVAGPPVALRAGQATRLRVPAHVDRHDPGRSGGAGRVPVGVARRILSRPVRPRDRICRGPRAVRRGDRRGVETCGDAMPGRLQGRGLGLRRRGGSIRVELRWPLDARVDLSAYYRRRSRVEFRCVRRVRRCGVRRGSALPLRLFQRLQPRCLEYGVGSRGENRDGFRSPPASPKRWTASSRERATRRGRPPSTSNAGTTPACWETST